MSDGLRADPPQGTDEADPTVGLSESAPDGATAPAGFAITRGKGFHVTFENGWTVSVQFGGGNYCENYNHLPIGNPGDAPHSKDAEVAVWGPTPDSPMIELDDGDVVSGWKTPAEVLALLNETAARGSHSALSSESANSAPCAVPVGDTPPSEPPTDASTDGSDAEMSAQVGGGSLGGSAGAGDDGNRRPGAGES